MARCTTGIAGTCTLTSPKMASAWTQVTFTVDGASGVFVYEHTENHDPDGDSDGTIITIAKP